MFFRFRTLAVPSLLFAAACSGDSSSDPSQDPPADPGPGQTVTPTDQKATGLGLSILSADASGAPRLLRSIVPRPAGAGMSPAAAARDHLAALKDLYVQQGKTMDLVDRGAQPLRNGAQGVTLTQAVDGIPVNGGDVHVLLHTDGSLAAVSGTLLASTLKPNYVSSPHEALGHAPDKQYGASGPQLASTRTATTAAGWQILQVANMPNCPDQ